MLAGFSAEIGAGDVGFREIGTLQFRGQHPGAFEIGAGEAAADQPCGGKVGAREIEAGEIEAFQFQALAGATQ